MAPSVSPSSPKRDKLGVSATKRRSRAGNKPPIRVLSADKSNFRNMVQKLTGIHPAAQAPAQAQAQPPALAPAPAPAHMATGFNHDLQYGHHLWPSYVSSHSQTNTQISPLHSSLFKPNATCSYDPHPHMDIANVSNSINARLGMSNNSGVITSDLAHRSMANDGTMPLNLARHGVVINANDVMASDVSRGGMSGGGNVSGSILGRWGMINDDGIGHYSNDNTKVRHVNASTMVGHHGGVVDLKSLFGASQYVGHDGSMGAHEGGAPPPPPPPPHFKMPSSHGHVGIKIDKLQIMRQVAELESLLMSNDKMDDFVFSPTNVPMPMWPSTDVLVHTPPPKVIA